jgi:site-specific recombinase XerD
MMAAKQSHRSRETGNVAPQQLSLFDLDPTIETAEVAANAESFAPDADSSELAFKLEDAAKHQEERTDESDEDAADESAFADLQLPRSLRPAATTLRAAIDEYQQYLAAMNRSKHTRDSFGLDLKLLHEHLGNVPVHAIGERDLRSFISWVSIQRSNSATSVRRKVATLKNFFAYLRRERAIPSDPAAGLIYPEIYPALPEFLEDRQVADLVEAAGEHLFWKALVRLMLDTGLKRDEVVALGRTDVVLSPGTDESYLVVRETEQAKRLRSRRLDIGDDLATTLSEFLSTQPERERFFDVSARGVNFIVETCGKRAGIATRGNKLTPQILRATFAVVAIRGMVAVEDARRAAGAPEPAIVAMAEEHDLQLLRLLGLHEEPESAKKYRKLVRGWSEHTRE